MVCLLLFVIQMWQYSVIDHDHVKANFNINTLQETTLNVTIIKRYLEFKGIVQLNIIFSYMKVNKICNLDHPV